MPTILATHTKFESQSQTSNTKISPNQSNMSRLHYTISLVEVVSDDNDKNLQENQNGEIDLSGRLDWLGQSIFVNVNKS